MSKVLKTLKGLPAEAKEKITPSTETQINSTHSLSDCKKRASAPRGKTRCMGEKIRTVHAYQGMIRFMLEELGLPGKDIMADITSDYLEDYVNFREKDFGMTNEEFISIIKRIS